MSYDTPQCITNLGYNKKAAGPSSELSEIAKTSREEVDISTDIVNTIVVEWAIPAEWEHSSVGNCYTGKRDFLEKRNFRGLKLTDQILKIVQRIVDKLIRQQVEIENVDVELHMSSKKDSYFLFVDLEKDFDWVAIRERFRLST